MPKDMSKNSKRIKFRPGKFVESNKELVNPERGFFQIHTFYIGERFEMGEREYTLNGKDSLAFVLIDISEYSGKELTGEALSQIREVFSFFREYRLDMIVRVVYDTEGKCMEKEPSSEELIVRHMEQLVPIICEYSGVIFVYQGLLIGNWGEMHSSKFLTPQRLRRLSDVFLKELAGVTYLSVRRPAYIRILFPAGEDMRQNAVGLYDDAILASPTHLGTFGEKSQKDAIREHSWLPQEEIEYVSELCDRVPYGGEALWEQGQDILSETRRSLKKLDDYFSKLHVSYLNRVHDITFWQNMDKLTWKKRGVFRGMHGTDYIERHLGYRFVVRNVTCVVKEYDLDTLHWNIDVENVGFSRCFFKCRVLVTGIDKAGKNSETDVSDWVDLRLVVAKDTRKIRFETPRIHGDIRMYVYKADTGVTVSFANERQKEELGHGLFLGFVKD